MLADDYFGCSVGGISGYRVVGVDVVVGMATQGLDCLASYLVSVML